MKRTFPKLKNKAILSPMAGVTDVAFRTLAKKYGAGLTYTEFLSSSAIVRGSKKTLSLVKTDPIEKPVAVQLFGHNIKEVIQAAKLVENKFDIIDINCGCPAWKVIKTGAGSAMLNDPDKIATFVGKIVSAVNIPVTVKIRSGIDAKHINAVDVARKIQDAGASAVAIHGRTQKQGYRGNADWKIITKVKEEVDIPVIGNGDVFTPEVFEKRLEESGVDAIMIARGAIGNPYVFTQIKDYIKTGEYDSKDKKEQFDEYLNLARKYNIPFLTIKTQAISFTKGTQGGAPLRNKLGVTKMLRQLEKVMEK
ncbi:tRNA dihydrouridine synthase DusB [archaeon]|nr:tRNA dihydrouridine synthase DusB [archaeon]